MATSTIRSKHACQWTGCNWSFARRSDLTRHINGLHIGLRPHACTQPGCDRRFSQKSALNVHMNTHTGAQPYPCRLADCPRTFGDPSSAARHYKEGHLKMAFVCPKCEKPIKRRVELNKHLLKHGVDPNTAVVNQARAPERPTVKASQKYRASHRSSLSSSKIGSGGLNYVMPSHATTELDDYLNAPILNEMLYTISPFHPNSSSPSPAESGDLACNNLYYMSYPTRSAESDLGTIFHSEGSTGNQNLQTMPPHNSASASPSSTLESGDFLPPVVPVDPLRFYLGQQQPRIFTDNDFNHVASATYWQRHA